MGPVWSELYSLDSTHFVIFLLISIEICQEIELISTTYVMLLWFWKKIRTKSILEQDPKPVFTGFSDKSFLKKQSE